MNVTETHMFGIKEYNNTILLDEPQLCGMLGRLGDLADGELEIRLGTFPQDLPKRYFDSNIGYVQFSRFHTYLSRYFREVSSGLNPVVTLDRKVTFDNEEYRVSITGQENIDNYVLGEYKNFGLVNPSAVEIVKKYTLSTLDDVGYNYRVCLSREEKIEGQLKAAILRQRLAGRPADARLKQRYSFSPDTEALDLRIDLTSVVQGEITSYQFEMEVVKGTTPQKEHHTFARKIINSLYEFLVFRQDTGFLTSSLILSTVAQSFRNSCERYWENRNFPGMKPVTVSASNLMNVRSKLEKNYTVTWKADGMRYVLYVYQQNLFFIDSNFNVIPTYMIDKGHSADEISILDGELIKKTGPNANGGEFYVFDIFVYKNRNTKPLPLHTADPSCTSRISMMKAFFKDFQPGNITCRVRGKVLSRSLDLVLKPYDVHDIEKKSVVYAETNMGDGIIFTPAFEPYPCNGSTFYTTYKWKKPSMNTIDFLVKFEKEICHRNQKYLVARLYVNHEGREQEFVYVENRPSSPNTSPMFVPVIDGHVTAINDGMPIQTETIIECMWGDFSECYGIAEGIVSHGFVPYRVRVEKTKRFYDNSSIEGTANSKKTALSIWESIVSPITVSQLFAPLPNANLCLQDTKVYYKDSSKGGNFYESTIMQFHNFIKESLILEAIALMDLIYPGGHIHAMDIGCGQGGDLYKWAKIHSLSSIAFADVIDANLTRAKERLYGRHEGDAGNGALESLRSKDILFSMSDFSYPIFPENILVVDGATGLLRFIKDSGRRNVVSTFFCLHFFYESREKLSALLWNINKSLSIGGLWIGTFMDGETVFGKELARVRVGQEIVFSCDGGRRKTFTLLKKESEAYLGEFGHKVAFKSTKISGAEDEAFIEYLVDLNKDIFQEFGFSIEYVKDFQSFWESFANTANRKRVVQDCPRLFDWTCLHKCFCMVKVQEASTTHRLVDGRVEPLNDLHIESEKSEQLLRKRVLSADTFSKKTKTIPVAAD